MSVTFLAPGTSLMHLALFATLALAWGDDTKPTTSPFVVGSVWQGTEKVTKPSPQTTNWKLIVTSRDGESFKADLVWLDQSATQVFRRIEGTLKADGSMVWHGAAGERRPGHPHAGTLKGDQIDARISGNLAGTAAAEGTLTLKRIEPGKENPGGASPPLTFFEFPDLDRLTVPLVVQPSAFFWREVAALLSFGYATDADKTRYPLTERLYLPYRSMKHTSLPRTGYPEADRALIARLDQLINLAPPEAKTAAAEARLVIRERLKLALANQRFGNTPDQSLDMAKIFFREAHEKAKALEEQLDHDESKQEMSPESWKRLRELTQSLGRDKVMELLGSRTQPGGLPPPIDFSAYLAYADMISADNQGAVWKKHLLPFVMKSAGSEAKSPIVELTAIWRKHGSKPVSERLDSFHLQNISGAPLSNAVVEIIAENEWGEQIAHYCYVKDWPAGAGFRALPHPRWERRQLVYTNSMKVMFTIWSDQARQPARTVALASPTPIPDYQKLRKIYTDYDKQYAPDSDRWRYRVLLGVNLDDRR